ncbi:sugar ABC transporter ATP-binding protein [Patulibacter sp. NPDC049589]|uniref:sugar ABC transporter ATP-binding protein n=1 Tax=Patulibacter sp. NPDC049589 TaxID=3154731 RepID=UPI00341BB224
MVTSIEHPSAPHRDAAPLLSIAGLRKSFGSTPVLRGIDFTARAGQVHGLLGTNGAGKSTMIKVLAGHHDADAGTIDVRDHRQVDSVGRIGVVHQDLALVDALTVRDNFHLSRRGGLTRAGLVDVRRERGAVTNALRAVNLDLDPETPLSELTLGTKSLLAVARLLANDADVLLLDEVTAALTRRESSWLLTEMRRLADEGRAVIVVSHRLHEIVEFCDEVTLLRDGSVAYAGPTPDLRGLHAMFESGGARPAREAGAEPRTGPVALRLDTVSRGEVGPIDLTVRRGEVVSVVGALSSGLYELGHLAAAATKPASGRRALSGREPGTPARCGFVPEDRKALGILPRLDVAANLTISAERRVFPRLWAGPASERRSVDVVMDDLSVHPRDPTMKIEDLSGGNQQKVLMGRTQLLDPDLLVLCEPTRGVDVGTRHAIYEYIESARASGAAILVVTIDVDDALAVADRVVVIESGSITSTHHRDEVDPVALLEKVS